MTEPAAPVRFTATLELGGKTATGFAVPHDVVAQLGPGKRPAVRVSIDGHTYESTVGVMGGRSMLPLSAENRTAAGVAAGDQIEVALVADVAPRTVEVPADLAALLEGDAAARATFDLLAPSHRKEWVRWVTDAKRPETRTTRLAATVSALAEGRKTR